MERFKNNKILILIVALLLMLFITSCDEDLGMESTKVGNQHVDKEESLEVHFIDVGQGDSVFIRQGDSNMLIDAGENSYGKVVVEYLKQEGVSKLDYVIGTHPHSDHIGGLDDVIEAFDIGKVIMPKVIHTTKTFEDVITAIEEKNLKITAPIVGDKHPLGNAEYTILGPSSDTYSNLNNYSVILKLDYGKTSFMFTGDAEKMAEEEVVNLNKDIRVDVLKVGHHGSTTSTIDEFLKQVNPSYAVIQVGEGNSYGLPDKETLDKLKDKNIQVYRNDIHGIIKIISDGNNLTFEVEKNSDDISDDIIENNETENNEEDIIENNEDNDIKIENYIGNKNSKIFHKEDCSSTVSENNIIHLNTREEAISEGFRPCKICNP